MGAIGTWDSAVSSDDLLNFAETIPSSLNYSSNTLSVCENQLGVPADAIEDEWNNGKSPELETSIRNYESVIANAITSGTEGYSWLEYVLCVLPRTVNS